MLKLRRIKLIYMRQFRGSNKYFLMKNIPWGEINAWLTTIRIRYRVRTSISSGEVMTRKSG
jgi:hypothetical protein